MGCAESNPKDYDISYPKQRPLPSLPRRRTSNPVPPPRPSSRPPVSKDKIIRTNQRQLPLQPSPQQSGGNDTLYTIQEVEDEMDLRNNPVPSSMQKTWSIPPPPSSAPPPLSGPHVHSVPSIALSTPVVAPSSTIPPPPPRIPPLPASVPPPAPAPPINSVSTAPPMIPLAATTSQPVPIPPSPSVPPPVNSVPTVATTSSVVAPPTPIATTTTTTISTTPTPASLPIMMPLSTASPSVIEPAAAPSFTPPPPPAAPSFTPPPPPASTPLSLNTSTTTITPPPPPPPSSSSSLSPTPAKPAAPARSRTVSGPVTPLLSSGKEGTRKGHVIVTNRLGFPKQAKEAIEFLHEQMEQRRYCGLKTVADVAAYVAQEVGLTSMPPSSAQKLFKDNHVKPIVFVAMTEQYLTTLGVTDSDDQMKILAAATTIQKNGNAELSAFLAEILVYQFQVMVSIFYEMAQDESNPELLLESEYEQFVHGLDWYLKSYAGGKKELTTFQVMILQVEFLKKKTVMVEQNVLINVAAVAKALVDQAMSRPDDARMYKMLGMGEAKLKETLELAGQSVVEMMKPFSLKLLSVYMKVLQKDIEAMETGQASPIRVSLKERMKSIGDTPDAIFVIESCAQSAQRLVDGPAKELGKTLLESVWPQLPEIYVMAAGRTV